jgi:hypothetical protein
MKTASKKLKAIQWTLMGVVATVALGGILIAAAEPDPDVSIEGVTAAKLAAIAAIFLSYETAGYLTRRGLLPRFREEDNPSPTTAKEGGKL